MHAPRFIHVNLTGTDDVVISAGSVRVYGIATTQDSGSRKIITFKTSDGDTYFTLTVGDINTNNLISFNSSWIADKGLTVAADVGHSTFNLVLFISNEGF